jgi:hypothetical protein
MALLSGLLLAYDNFVQCLTINIKTAKLEDVKSSLINEEKKRQEKKKIRKIFQVKMNKFFILKQKKEKENGTSTVFKQIEETSTYHNCSNALYKDFF